MSEISDDPVEAIDRSSPHFEALSEIVKKTLDTEMMYDEEDWDRLAAAVLAAGFVPTAGGLVDVIDPEDGKSYYGMRVVVDCVSFTRLDEGVTE